MSTLQDDPDETRIPPPKVRGRLLEALAGIVKARGFERLVLCPLVRPDEEFFPDPWHDDEQSMVRVAQRLAIYAGAADVEVAVREVLTEKDLSGIPAPYDHDRGVWLIAANASRWQLGVYRPHLPDAAQVVPAMARAVAAGWRASVGLGQSDIDMEATLIDVTAIYLGFGILTTRASLRHEAEAGSRSRLKTTAHKLGRLSPMAACFLLAAQMVARELDHDEIVRVAKALSPNQAAFFTRSYALLAELQPAVATILGVPSREQWPSPPELAELTAPLAVDPPSPSPARGRRDEVAGINEGRPVFRVERSKALSLARLLGFPALAVGVVAARALPELGFGFGHAFGLAGGLAVVGVLLGSMFRESTCSEPRCGSKLDTDASHCPRCGGDVLGTIAHPRERLAAEEALRQSRD